MCMFSYVSNTDDVSKRCEFLILTVTVKVTDYDAFVTPP